jgi:hypothetical protein
VDPVADPLLLRKSVDHRGGHKFIYAILKTKTRNDWLRAGRLMVQSLNPSRANNFQFSMLSRSALGLAYLCVPKINVGSFSEDKAARA